MQERIFRVFCAGLTALALVLAPASRAHAITVFDPTNLAQNLPVTGPSQLWVADSAYIALLSGFVYLAVILDRFARRVVGYALSRNIDTALCLEALRMALALRRPPKGIVHHSDRGVQYASCDYVNELYCPVKV